MKIGVVQGTQNLWLNSHITPAIKVEDIIIRDTEFYLFESADDIELVVEKFRINEIINKVKLIDEQYGKRKNVLLDDGGCVIVFPNFASADKYFNDRIRDEMEDTPAVHLTKNGKVYEYTIVHNNEYVISAFHY